MSYSALLLPNGKQRFVDNNGDALVGGKVYFYADNSSTPKDTYKNPTLSILNLNPVILDARGEAVIYGAGDYRQVVTDSLDNLIWDVLTQGYQAPAADTGITVLSITVDGGGSPPSTGICGDLYVPFDCTIISNTVQATTAGSIVFDVWATVFIPGFPPTVANTICASAKPTLSSAQGSIDMLLTGWAVDLVAGTWVRFKIDSISTLTRATLQLMVRKT